MDFVRAWTIKDLASCRAFATHSTYYSPVIVKTTTSPGESTNSLNFTASGSSQRFKIGACSILFCWKTRTCRPPKCPPTFFKASCNGIPAATGTSKMTGAP